MLDPDTPFDIESFYDRVTLGQATREELVALFMAQCGEDDPEKLRRRCCSRGIDSASWKEWLASAREEIQKLVAELRREDGNRLNS